MFVVDVIIFLILKSIAILNGILSRFSTGQKQLNLPKPNPQHPQEKMKSQYLNEYHTQNGMILTEDPLLYYQGDNLTLEELEEKLMKEFNHERQALESHNQMAIQTLEAVLVMQLEMKYEELRLRINLQNQDEVESAKRLLEEFRSERENHMNDVKGILDLRMTQILKEKELLMAQRLEMKTMLLNMQMEMVDDWKSEAKKTRDEWKKWHDEKTTQYKREGLLTKEEFNPDDYLSEPEETGYIVPSDDIGLDALFDDSYLDYGISSSL